MFTALKTSALSLLAAVVVAFGANAQAWTASTDDKGNVTYTATLSSPTLVTNPLNVNASVAGVVYVRSSAANSTSLTVLTGPDATISGTFIPAATAATTAVSKTLSVGAQRTVWGRASYITGDTATHTFKVLQPNPKAGAYSIGNQ